MLTAACVAPVVAPRLAGGAMGPLGSMRQRGTWLWTARGSESGCQSKAGVSRKRVSVESGCQSKMGVSRKWVSVDFTAVIAMEAWNWRLSL